MKLTLKDTLLLMTIGAVITKIGLVMLYKKHKKLEQDFLEFKNANS